MGMKIVFLCITAAGLAAASSLLSTSPVVQSCSTGKEFITTFLPNYVGTKRVKHYGLYLVLTSQDSKADIQIEVGSKKEPMLLTLSPRETRWVKLPLKEELRSFGTRDNSAVRVTASSDISVVSFNLRFATGSGTTVMPSNQLGTDYVVFTPEGRLKQFSHLVAVVNGPTINKVTFTAGAKYFKENTVTLKPYATYMIGQKYTLSGIRVRSKQPVALLTGNQCLSLGGKCEHVYQQLPPVARLGTHYLVPVTKHKHSQDTAIIMATEDKTLVTIHKEKAILQRKLKPGQDLRVKVDRNTPLVVEGNRKLMVLLLSNNGLYDPFFIPLLPSSQMATDWSLDTVKDLRSTAVILSEREGSHSATVCQMLGKKRLCSKPDWKEFHSDSKWAWSSVYLGTEQDHVTIQGDALMVVYVYGGKHRHGYSITGVCSEAAVPPTMPPDPCESVVCREKEKCVMGACVHVSTATCHALGDPHYKTFDGRRFDFQGTCTYTMVTVTNATTGLTPFTVTTKNNHRGNKRVSFVRTVTVSVYDLTLVFSERRGKIEVNGELVYLPVSLLNGRVSVKYSRGFAELTTDFGLKVKYDSNMKLYITVPSSYYRHLGGLCGNYNGDPRDDLPRPTGAKLNDVLQMIAKWKLAIPDPFCNDNCGGRCPTCSRSERAHFSQPKRCGILTKPNGPFSACHKVVDPGLYLDNCVFDVCINKGSKQMLCDNLNSYYEACLSEGVNINWRIQAGCPLACPRGSRYTSCGSSCPASCDVLNPPKCKGPCVDGCECNHGLVLSGDKCVPVHSCGCSHKGRYYPAGTTFWDGDQCNTKCACVRGNSKAVCRQVGCKKNEKCSLKGGVRDCYPVSFATCQASGDPHYRTFDKRRFDFQGTCTYVLSQTVKSKTSSLVPFRVLVQNEHRGRQKTVSYTKSVSITVFGHTVSMSSERYGQVLVNSQSVNLPFSTEDEDLSVYRHGSFAVVKASSLTFRFNWRSFISVKLPSSYQDQLEGLCGNYNSKPKDDFMTPDGSKAKTPSLFGDSWKVGGAPGCTSDCPGGKCPQCEPELVVRYGGKGYCGLITDSNGPFRHCQSKLKADDFLSDCVFDLCAYGGHATALCNSLSAFTSSCQEAGAKMETWRTQEFCPLPCGSNSHYEVCAAPCPQTCNGLGAPQGCDPDAPCDEGCVCDDGFLLSHDTCVPVAECGCQYNNRYYRIGEVFFEGNACSGKCVCRDDGQVECDKAFSCAAKEKCVVEGGVASCVPKSTASCSVGGDRTVKSFDGQRFSLWGDCVFMLSEVEQTDGRMKSFSVLLRQRTSGNDVTRSIEVQLYDLTITMETGVVWEIRVDEIRANLPVSLADGRVWVNQIGMSIVLETHLGVKLTYDTVAGVILQLPSTYQGLPSGLCGNYNENPKDDLVLANQTNASSPEKFSSAWLVEEEEGKGSSCPTECTGEICKDDKDKDPDAEKDCDIIKDKKGPLAGCHAVVPPKHFYKACVKELSSRKRRRDILCRHIQIYVSTCQSAGATVKEWRSNNFCPVTCPSGSHYELCSESCASSCASLDAPPPCSSCQEGCQCDEGLLWDGGRCAPLETCGCWVEGRYYQSGVTVMKDDCLERCACKAGRFSCSKSSCLQGEECRNKDGTLGCHKIDPCAEVKCRVKEHCEVQGGKGVCVPESSALCWVFGDPHYSTFDGYKYPFQGTCTYTLLTTKGFDTDLPEVTLTTKNELRGNSEGSFVRSVTVELLGHRIDILAGHRPFVEVDGRRSDLPLNLEGASISMSKSGIRGVLQTDIGVKVTFDWSTLVMVSITSSFFGNVGGLCGNYNGNRDDELVTPSGSKVANVTEWMASWSVPDGDPFCYHHCEGVCPQCSEKDRKRFLGPEFCGILSNKTGPFASCHGSVEVGEFVSDCLYDVCLNDGRQEVLCGMLNDYTIECQEAGAKVLPWRGQANCPIVCPPNSHYSECGSSCPDTCGPQPVVCPKICAEGCFCDKGFVLSGEKCVDRQKECGCTFNERYFLPGEVFWADETCERRCVCSGATHTVTCEDTSCKAEEHCSVVDGIQGCYPINFQTCYAQGDPHFRTFDGKKFDFQGNCVYRLAEGCGHADNLPAFQVTLENNNRGSKKVSFAKVVKVVIYGSTYELTAELPGVVLVDGIATALPYSFNQSVLEVRRRHRFAILETKFLQVSYDWSSAVRVKLATTYQSATCGLCGNMNGDPGDDLWLANGKPASSAKEFGVSHWLANVPGCEHDCKDCAKPLPPGQPAPGFTKVCNILVDKTGPLKDCVKRVDSTQYHSDCVYDMTLTNGRMETACDIIADFVEECQSQQEVKLRPWRRDDLCPMKCPSHSVYSISAPGCAATCSSLTTPTACKDPPGEGCVCKAGYLLSQDRCVPLADCGCRHEGRYFESGQTFYEDHLCHRLCYCNEGMVSCSKSPCKEKETCEVRAGVRACYPQGMPSGGLNKLRKHRKFLIKYLKTNKGNKGKKHGHFNPIQQFLDNVLRG